MLMNNISPVSLFADVCGNTNLLCTIHAHIWLMTFMVAIIKTKHQIHDGTVSIVINLIEQQITKTISAILSNIAPLFVSALSLRATYPSAMSVIPQIRKRSQKGDTNCVVNSSGSRHNAPTILDDVI